MNKAIKKMNIIVTTMAVTLVLVLLLGIKDAYAEGAPKLLISGYSIEEGRAAAGEEFKVKFTVENKSTAFDADSILLTFSNESNSVLPVQGNTNQAYIDVLPKGGSAEVVFSMKIDHHVNVETLPVNFRMDYSYGDGSIVDNNVTCTLELEPSCTLDIITLSVSDTTYNDGNAYISFYGKNTGNVDIKNLAMNVKGNVREGDKKLDIGTIPDGSAKNQDFCVVLNEKGSQIIDIYFTYNDELGNEYVIGDRSYVIEVTDEQGLANNEKGIFNAIKNATWQTYVVIIAGFAIIFLVFLYKRIQRYA